MSEFSALPENTPIPIDDGAADHLFGRDMPSLALQATSGVTIDLALLTGLTVLFAYPRTGRSGQQPLSVDWDMIPGARGCNREVCAFRDLHLRFASVRARVFGLSTQHAEFQLADVRDMNLPFPLLSDADLRLTEAIQLPTMIVSGLTLLRRLTLVIEDGRIRRVFYPVFPPDRAPDDVLAALEISPSASLP